MIRGLKVDKLKACDLRHVFKKAVDVEMFFGPLVLHYVCVSTDIEYTRSSVNDHPEIGEANVFALQNCNSQMKAHCKYGKQ